MSLYFDISYVISCRQRLTRCFSSFNWQITRRYAEFSAALVGLNESFSSDRVNQLLSQLQNEVENFILRMAAEFPQRKEQLVFLINNYDMMLAVIVVCLSSHSLL